MDYQRSSTQIDFEVDVVPNTKYILTELGELFYKACQEKNNI